MHLTVSSQTAGVLEGLATLFTHIWPLTCVLPQVVLVVRAPLESERAVRALECPNTCVYLGKVNMGGGAFCHYLFLHILACICLSSAKGVSISWTVKWLLLLHSLILVNEIEYDGVMFFF